MPCFCSTSETDFAQKAGTINLPFWIPSLSSAGPRTPLYLILNTFNHMFLFYFLFSRSVLHFPAVHLESQFKIQISGSSQELLYSVPSVHHFVFFQQFYFFILSQRFFVVVNLEFCNHFALRNIMCLKTAANNKSIIPVKESIRLFLSPEMID